MPDGGDFKRRPTEILTPPADEDLLLRYQRLLLETTALCSVTVCEKSRRIGYTWAIAADAVLTCAMDKKSGGMDVFYLAYEREMTREFIDTCAAWAKLFDKACAEVEEFMFVDKAKKRDDVDKHIQAFRIRFASGHEIVALSSSPRGLRGRQGMVIIDEAAFHDDLDEVLKAAMALLMWGGKVVILSTHNGVDNPFNKLLDDVRAGRKPYKLITVTLDDAIAQGLYRRICLTQGREWSAEAEQKWRDEIVANYGDAADEELFCIPSEGAGSWIPYELILAAEHEDAGKPELFTGGSVYLGNDIARRKDNWVVEALERVGDVLWQREESVLKNAKFAEHDAEIDRLWKFYNPLRLAMDQTGMGEKPVEDMKTAHGELRVEGVIMSSDRRLAVATSGKQAFENGKIRIMKDPALRSDLKKIKKTSGPTGSPRLVTGRDASGHSDRAWALFLAIAAADGGGQPAAGETVAADREALRARRPAPADRGLEQLLAGGSGRMFERRPSGLFTRRGSTGER